MVHGETRIDCLASMRRTREDLHIKCRCNLPCFPRNARIWQLLVVVLGAKSSVARCTDTRNLYRWAEHEPEPNAPVDHRPRLRHYAAAESFNDRPRRFRPPVDFWLVRLPVDFSPSSMFKVARN